MTDAATSPRRTARAGGRPRSTAVDGAILAAAFRALTTDGYAQMSIEAVAAAAGVGKTTIYRRYPTKRELAAAAITTMTVVGPQPADQHLRGALIGLLTQGREAVVGQRAVTMIGTLLVEERREPELIALFREKVIGPRRGLLLQMLSGARTRGELGPDADIEVAADMIVGGLFAHYLAGEPVDDAWIVRLVDATLLAAGSVSTASGVPRAATVIA